MKCVCAYGSGYSWLHGSTHTLASLVYNVGCVLAKTGPNRMQVKDKNPAGAATLGTCSIPCSQIVSSFSIEGAQPLYTTKKTQRGHLFITLEYTPFTSETTTTATVPGLYFDPHPGNLVRLYSCAHSVPDMVQPVDVQPGIPYDVHSCWNDMFTAITSAQKFVFLTGWSMNPFIRLVRDESAPEHLKELGQLLKV